MNGATLSVNIIAFIFLLLAILKDRKRTKKALRIAVRSLIGMLPMILIIIILIGILLSFVTPEKIQGLLGEESGILGILSATLIGSVMHIPSLIAFPLAASLVEGGAALGTVAGFIVSLTMIGIITFPIELRELGVKMTIMRNGFGFLFSVIIALLIGVLV